MVCYEWVAPIQMMVDELTRIGEEMNCTSECLQIIRDRYATNSNPSTKGTATHIHLMIDCCVT